MLSCLANNVIDMCGGHTAWHCGLEAHMKGRPDGIISSLNGTRARANVKETIADPCDLKEAYEYEGIKRSVSGETATWNAPLIVNERWPPPKDEVRRQIRKLCPASLPALLAQTHTYSFTKNHRRRTKADGPWTRREYADRRRRSNAVPPWYAAAP